MAAKSLFYQMPKDDKAWCPYYIVDALAHMAAFGLTLREAGQAVIAWQVAEKGCDWRPILRDARFARSSG